MGYDRHEVTVADPKKIAADNEARRRAAAEQFAREAEAAAAARAALPPTTPTTDDAATQVTLPERPDLAGARQSFQQAVSDYEAARRGPGPATDAKAVAATDAISGAESRIDPAQKVASVDAGWLDPAWLTPWYEQVKRSFGTQSIDPGVERTWAERLKGEATNAAGLTVDALTQGATLKAAQVLQKQANEAAAHTPSDTIAGRVAAGVKKGIAGAIDQVVPDESASKSVTGTAYKPPMESMRQIGEMLQEAGRAETANAPTTLDGKPVVSPFATGKVAAGLVLSTPAEVDDAVKAGLGLSIRPEDEYGLPAENGVFATMRVLGSVGWAGLTTLVENAPLLPPGTTPKPDDPNASVMERALAAVTPTTVAEGILGEPAKQVTERPTWMGDLGQQFLERIERGDGVEAEGQQLATRVLGPEYADEGWIVGNLLGMFANPELAIMRPAQAMGRMARTARAMGEVEKSSVLTRLAKSVEGSTASFGDTAGAAKAFRIEEGLDKVEDVPEAILPYLRERAAWEHTTPEEVFALDGLAAPPAVADAEHMAYAAQQAEQQAKKVARKPATEAIAAAEAEAQAARDTLAKTREALNAAVAEREAAAADAGIAAQLSVEDQRAVDEVMAPLQAQRRVWERDVAQAQEELVAAKAELARHQRAAAQAAQQATDRGVAAAAKDVLSRRAEESARLQEGVRVAQERLDALNAANKAELDAAIASDTRAIDRHVADLRVMRADEKVAVANAEARLQAAVDAADAAATQNERIAATNEARQAAHEIASIRSRMKAKRALPIAGREADDAWSAWEASSAKMTDAGRAFFQGPVAKMLEHVNTLPRAKGEDRVLRYLALDGRLVDVPEATVRATNGGQVPAQLLDGQTTWMLLPEPKTSSMTRAQREAARGLNAEVQAWGAADGTRRIKPTGKPRFFIGAEGERSASVLDQNFRAALSDAQAAYAKSMDLENRYRELELAAMGPSPTPPVPDAMAGTNAVGIDVEKASLAAARDAVGNRTITPPNLKAPFLSTRRDRAMVARAEDAVAAAKANAAMGPAAAAAERVAQVAPEAVSGANVASAARKVGDARAQQEAVGVRLGQAGTGRSPDLRAGERVALESARASGLATEAEARAAGQYEAVVSAEAKASKARAKAAKMKTAATTRSSMASIHTPAAQPAEVYAVRNKLGDIMASASSVDEAAAIMAKRATEGDELWRGTERAVARWATSEPGARLIATGAVGHDATVLERLTKDAAPVKLRSFATPESRAVGSAIGQVFGMPASRPPRTRTGAMIRDAYAMWARDRMGSDELTWLPASHNGKETAVLVTHYDRKRIVGNTARDLAAAGLGDGKATLEYLKGRKLTDAQVAVVEDLAKKWGVDIPDPQAMTPAQVRELQSGGFRHYGGAIADARQRVRGAPLLAETITRTLATFHGTMTDTEAGKLWGRPTGAFRTGGPIVDALRATPILGPAGQTITARFFDDVTATLPPQSKAAMLQMRSRLERVPDDFIKRSERLFADYRKANKVPRLATLTDGQIVEVYETMLTGVRPVQRGDLEVARTWREPGQDIRAVREGLVASKDFPRWAVDAESDAVIRAGLQDWSDAIVARSRLEAREFVDQVLFASGKDIRKDSALLNWRPTDETLDRVYDEVFVNGDIRGPAATKLIADAKIQAPRFEEGLVVYLVKKEQDRVLAEEIGALLDSGLVISDPELKLRTSQVADDKAHALVRMLNGDTNVTPGQRAWAERTTRAMGLQLGVDHPLKKITVSGHTFHAPEFFEEQLVGLLAAGKITPKDLTSLGASYADGIKFWKENATMGLIAPRPQYALAQALGQVNTLWLNRGLLEAMQHAPNVLVQGVPFVEKPGMVGAIMSALNDERAMATHDPLAKTIVDVNGQVHSLAEVVDLARKNGMADSIVNFEMGPLMSRILTNENTALGRLTFAPRAWQDMIRSYGGGFDQAARISVFVKELERGTPAAEAARIARGAALDFRNITPWESKVLRHGFTFYAYQRKASDALVVALLKHPERVAQQARIAWTASHRDRTPEQMGQVSPRAAAQLRVPIPWLDDSVVSESGHVNPLRKWSFVTGGIGLADNILQLQSLLALPGLAVEAATLGQAASVDEATKKQVVESVNPFAQILSIAFTGTKMGVTFEGSKSNAIPPVLANGPTRDWLFSTFHVDCVPMEPGTDPLDADAGATACMQGLPAYWAAGGGEPDPVKKAAYQRAWQSFLMAASSSPRTLEGYARAVGALDPRGGLDQLDEAAGFLLGMPATPEPTVDMAIQKGLEQRTRKMGAGERAMTQDTPTR